MVQSNTTLMLKKIRIDRNEFITRDKLFAYCRSFKLDYDEIIPYYLRKGYITRIFKGIFYVNTPSELNLKSQKYNHLELVAKGLNMKSVSHWYFGLHTALKLNNMTHEHFTVNDVISDTLLRMRPMSISGSKFKFTRISSKLYGFGIIRKPSRIKGISIRYSNPEKTILDFAYLWSYRGYSPQRILSGLADWTENLNEKNLHIFSKRYPLSVQRIIKVIE